MNTPSRARVSALAGGGLTAAAALALFGAAAPASAETAVDRPSSFTSAYTVMATPDQVLNAAGVSTPGPAGATGQFTFQINSDLDIICYDITITGATGEYMSPAKTATHIHAAAAGKAGPPRIAFPNPSPVGDGPRTSAGCLQGPFTTGILADGVDTGSGFELSSIEDDFASYASDVHTVASPAGLVRGQLTQVPVGGVQTGGGGTAASAADTNGTATSVALVSAGVGAAALLAVGGVVLHRRRSTAASE